MFPESVEASVQYDIPKLSLPFYADCFPIPYGDILHFFAGIALSCSLRAISQFMCRLERVPRAQRIARCPLCSVIQLNVATQYLSSQWSVWRRPMPGVLGPSRGCYVLFGTSQGWLSLCRSIRTSGWPVSSCRVSAIASWGRPEVTTERRCPRSFTARLDYIRLMVDVTSDRASHHITSQWMVIAGTAAGGLLEYTDDLQLASNYRQCSQSFSQCNMPASVSSSLYARAVN